MSRISSLFGHWLSSSHRPLDLGALAVRGGRVLAGPVGPGNATWAFEWDATVWPGGTLEISKIKGVKTEMAKRPKLRRRKKRE